MTFRSTYEKFWMPELSQWDHFHNTEILKQHPDLQHSPQVNLQSTENSKWSTLTTILMEVIPLMQKWDTEYKWTLVLEVQLIKN